MEPTTFSEKLKELGKATKELESKLETIEAKYRKLQKINDSNRAMKNEYKRKYKEYKDVSERAVENTVESIEIIDQLIDFGESSEAQLFRFKLYAVILGVLSIVNIFA